MNMSQFSLSSRLNRLDIPTIIKPPQLSGGLELPTTEFPPQENPPKAHEEEYSGFIIVRLSAELPLPSEESETLQAVAKEFRLRGLEEILNEYDLSTNRKLIRSQKPRNHS